MKLIFPLIFFFFFFSGSTYTQNRLNFLNGLHVSLKAGFHTGDGEHIFDNFPPGFSIDGTMDHHTGKDWYVGLNYDISFANDLYYGEDRSFTNYNFSANVKKRFFFKDADVYVGLALGTSSMSVNGSNNDKMIAMNFRAGADFRIDKNVIASFETVYLSMSEFDMGGGGRHHNIIQLKAGLGYVFTLDK